MAKEELETEDLDKTPEPDVNLEHPEEDGPSEPGGGADSDSVSPSLTPETVPVGVLVEERHRRQALEVEVATQKQRFEKLDERLSVLNERMAPAETDRDEDPLGWLSQKHETLEAQTKEQTEAISRLQGMIESSQLQQQVAAQEAQFTSQHPDYGDAATYLLERVQSILPPGLGDLERKQYINQYAQWITSEATKVGRSPAEAVYSLAKDAGFAPGETPKGDPLAEVARGIKASKSLSSAPGKTPKALTLEALGELDDDDFDAATEGGNWEKLHLGS